MAKVTFYNKLIRDKIPDILISKDIEFEVDVIDDTDINKYQIKKMYEELEELEVELLAEDQSPDDILGELVDVYDVLRAIANSHDYSLADIVQHSIQKEQTNGGFAKNLRLKTTTTK